jgi:hypothetical protein
MTLWIVRSLEHVHGHLGWLSVGALLHPAILLRNAKRRARLAVALATSLVFVTALLGGCVYPVYRERIKQHLFIEAPRIGWMFERKEHLAVGAVALSLVGCLAHLGLPWISDEASKQTMARLAHRAFVLAFALALLVAVLGVSVASFESF